MNAIIALLKAFAASARDLLPIVVVIVFFQIVVLKEPLPNILSIGFGLVLVILGLTFFIFGLEMGLFPIGESMAQAFARKGSVFWLMVFAFCLGFGTTIAEPALTAVANEAAEGGYIGVVVLTGFAPETIIGIAYDSGGVTTSTITVPLVTALGVGLASSIKGRNPMIDGFGLIAFASLLPMMFVMIYGMVVA